MDEHSIEELKQQWRQAQHRLKDAQDAERAAKALLRDAQFEATGFKGCIAEYKRSGKKVQFLPNRVSFGGSFIEGPRLKRDGTPGLVDGYCDVGVATNLGPYTPPA